MAGYELLDSGYGRKLERFGSYILDRPAPQALWKPLLSQKQWKTAYAFFKRKNDQEGVWVFQKDLPSSWVIEHQSIQLKVALTDFGHTGLFPEHLNSWEWIQKYTSKGSRILNLFAYSGAASLACAQRGAQVSHLDH